MIYEALHCSASLKRLVGLT